MTFIHVTIHIVLRLCLGAFMRLRVLTAVNMRRTVFLIVKSGKSLWRFRRNIMLPSSGSHFQVEEKDLSQGKEQIRRASLQPLRSRDEISAKWWLKHQNSRHHILDSSTVHFNVYMTRNICYYIFTSWLRIGYRSHTRILYWVRKKLILKLETGSFNF
jgi:hypothetical protein